MTAFVYNQSDSQESQLVSIVKINGLVVDEWPLDAGLDKEITYYPNQGQYNIVQIKDSSIRVKEDNSPDQIAVNTGWISKPGQILVCLPHQLMIEIQEKGDSTDDTEESEDELILPI